MKRLSIKFKVTFWFTLMMLLIVAAVLNFLLEMGERIVYEETHEKLTTAVKESFDEIKYRFGELDIDDDLDFYNEGVYIAVYNTDGSLLYGRLPSGFDRSLPFLSGEIQTVGEGEHRQYIYDLVQNVGNGYEILVRGVLSASGSEHAFSALLRLAMIMFPVLTVIAALVGYLLTKRAFRPVKQIAEAAEHINNGNDLTRRIGLEKGNDEIHKLANEFDMMFDRLQESFENEKRFTSDASHELRTPMAVIITQAEDALKNQETRGEAREALEAIHGKATEMSALISGLLMLARADRGHLKIHRENTDLSALSEMVCEQAKELAADMQIDIISEIEPGIHINGDETMLIRMLLNLCENGIKYGRVGGFLKITLKRESNFAICTVEDNGIGIAEENIGRIWERFFREDEARTSGSGLGLPLAKYICEAHDGNIRVESELGKGSIFEFRIPLDQ